jgi:hypothetical protein
MARVTLLGSLAISVGGVVPASKAGNVASSVSLQANARITAEAELKVAVQAETTKAKQMRYKAKSCGTDSNKTKTSGGKAMKNSINNKTNWWTASLLGVPVDGSSN